MTPFNKAFFHMMETGRPYVMMKYAMTIDGKVAAHTGMSHVDNVRRGEGGGPP